MTDWVSAKSSVGVSDMGNVCITPVVHRNRKKVYAQRMGEGGDKTQGVSERGKVEPENGAALTDFPRDW